MTLPTQFQTHRSENGNNVLLIDPSWDRAAEIMQKVINLAGQCLNNSETKRSFLIELKDKIVTKIEEININLPRMKNQQAAVRHLDRRWGGIYQGYITKFNELKTQLEDLFLRMTALISEMEEKR